MKLFKKNKNHLKANYIELQNISKMFNEILKGPLSIQEGKVSTSEYSFDDYSNNKYEDDIFILYCSSETGIGIGKTPGYKTIYLKNYGEVYDGNHAYDTHLWYNHLKEIYDKTIEKKQRTDYLYHKVIHLCDYVPSGYSDGIIKVEYEKKIIQTYSQTEDGYIPVATYSCKIFLIPLGEYVFIEDNIYHQLETTHREGKWVDYVCSIIDDFENKKHVENKKVKEKILKHNNRPIHDSHIFQ